LTKKQRFYLIRASRKLAFSCALMDFERRERSEDEAKTNSREGAYLSK
jgi:hypothetical protein